LRLALPALEPFLEENVAKEARKDALVIQRAGEAPAPGAAREILAAARAIDREFLARVGAFALRIQIPYERIEPLRLRREEGEPDAWSVALLARALGARNARLVVDGARASEFERACASALERRGVQLGAPLVADGA